MFTQAETRALVDDIFEDLALVVGGLVAVGELPERLVQPLVESLERIHGNAVGRLEGHGRGGRGTQHDPRPHPAIEEFLAGLRAE